MLLLGFRGKSLWWWKMDRGNYEKNGRKLRKFLKKIDEKVKQNQGKI